MQSSQDPIESKVKSETSLKPRSTSAKARNSKNLISGSNQQNTPEDELTRFNKLISALGGEFTSGTSSTRIVHPSSHKKFVPNITTSQKSKYSNIWF